MTSILDPESIAAARRKLHGTAKMADPQPDPGYSLAQQAAKQQQHATNQIYRGGMATIGGTMDPAYEAERKAREDRELRTMCVHVASQEHFGGGDVVTRAKQFYDFIKGA